MLLFLTFRIFYLLKVQHTSKCLSIMTNNSRRGMSCWSNDNLTSGECRFSRSMKSSTTNRMLDKCSDWILYLPANERSPMILQIMMTMMSSTRTQWLRLTIINYKCNVTRTSRGQHRHRAPRSKAPECHNTSCILRSLFGCKTIWKKIVK